MKIGIIREGKIPTDKRTAITPKQAKQIKEKFPHVEVVAQTSAIRCFSDDEYRNEGITVVENVEDCDILVGVKEVPIKELIPHKTYFFFSHTIKKQSYNQKLLQAVLEKKIRLIDYETLTDEAGNRVIAFGRYAGIVGAYNGIKTYGEKFNRFRLKPANQCFDMAEMWKEFEKVNLPAIKIAVTGSGRVAKGAIEVLRAMNIKEVSPQDYLQNTYNEAVFAKLSSKDYHKTKDGSAFVSDYFYKNPEKFDGDFLKYAQQTDVLIAAAYWDNKAPVLFTKGDMKDKSFKIKVIADVTCDIDGSIPATQRPSTIADPVYDYNPFSESLEIAYHQESNIAVMAVDNLPCELPRNASQDFGNEMVNVVLPCLLDKDPTHMIERASITQHGALTSKYAYLHDYAYPLA